MRSSCRTKIRFKISINIISHKFKKEANNKAKITMNNKVKIIKLRLKTRKHIRKENLN